MSGFGSFIREDDKDDDSSNARQQQQSNRINQLAATNLNAATTSAPLSTTDAAAAILQAAAASQLSAAAAPLPAGGGVAQPTNASATTAQQMTQALSGDPAMQVLLQEVLRQQQAQQLVSEQQQNANVASSLQQMAGIAGVPAPAPAPVARTQMYAPALDALLALIEAGRAPAPAAAPGNSGSSSVQQSQFGSGAFQGLEAPAPAPVQQLPSTNTRLDPVRLLQAQLQEQGQHQQQTLAGLSSALGQLAQAQQAGIAAPIQTIESILAVVGAAAANSSNNNVQPPLPIAAPAQQQQRRQSTGLGSFLAPSVGQAAAAPAATTSTMTGFPNLPAQSLLAAAMGASSPSHQPLNSPGALLTTTTNHQGQQGNSLASLLAALVRPSAPAPSYIAGGPGLSALLLAEPTVPIQSLLAAAVSAQPPAPGLQVQQSNPLGSFVDPNTLVRTAADFLASLSRTPGAAVGAATASAPVSQQAIATTAAQPAAAATTAITTAPTSAVGRPTRHEAFPVKLMRMLAEVEKADKDDIISFTIEGTAFEIHRPDAFEEEIIPHYFRHNRLASFRRQLSQYGFKKLTEGPDIGAYAHAQFLKERPDLCRDIRRVG